LTLELHGYRVATARDGVDALDWLSRGEQPGLILLDMMMPNLDGEGVVAAVRRQPSLRSVPIVLLSRHWEAMKKAADLDVTASLVKPIPADVLLATVARVIADGAEQPAGAAPDH